MLLAKSIRKRIDSVMRSNRMHPILGNENPSARSADGRWMVMLRARSGAAARRVSRGQIMQGSDPGGGKRGPLQEKKSSESVAQRAARARPTQWRLHFCTQSGNVITLCFGYYTSNSRPTEKHPFCHAGLSYCRCLPNSDRNSQLSSFLSPSFELASFPHLHLAIVFLSHPFLAS